MMMTDLTHMLRKLGYPCIFVRSQEEAAHTLFRLIARGECGFDEGREKWRALLRATSGSPSIADELNACGATFSEQEWQCILTNLLQMLTTDPRPGAPVPGVVGAAAPVFCGPAASASEETVHPDDLFWSESRIEAVTMADGSLEVLASSVYLPGVTAPQAVRVVFEGVVRLTRTMTEYIGDPRNPAGFREPYTADEVHVARPSCPCQIYALEGITVFAPIGWLDLEIVATNGVVQLR